MPVHRAQRYTLADFRGTLEAVEPELRELADARPARPMFRCMLAHVHARTGRTAEAAAALGELTADDCAALPFDQEWLYGMSCLADTAALLDDASAAERLAPLLAPWTALNVVDQCEGLRGATSRYLGLLAATTGREEDAERYFADALAANARMGLRPWLARAREDFAQLLSSRDPARAAELRAAALAEYRELGMAPASSARRASERGFTADHREN